MMSLAFRRRLFQVLACVGVGLGFGCGDAYDLPRYSFLEPRGNAAPDILGDSAFWANVRQSMPFDSIALSRICHEGCPEYTLVLGRDGDARYLGSLAATRAGEWKGEVNFLDFARLCHFIEASGVLEELPDSSTVEMSHGWKYELRLWPTGQNEPKRFTGWEFEGPTKVWLLRSAIDGVSSRLIWRRVGSQPETPH